MRVRFFRGISVPKGEAAETAHGIEERGIVKHQWRWVTTHQKLNAPVLRMPIPTLDDTRSADAQEIPAVCACGDLDGASYYAWQHNLGTTNDTPVLIEFEAPLEAVVIDGKDCLYTVFQMGDPTKAADFIRAAYGDKGLEYAEKAWRSDDQPTRIAICDQLTNDSEVITAHYANRLVIGGRHGTVFRSSFTIDLPIVAQAVVRAWIPDEIPLRPRIDVNFDELLARH
jgi:hypothetical protein